MRGANTMKKLVRWFTKTGGGGPTPSVPSPSVDESVEIVRAGSDYLDLISRPGWQRLLDDMEARANTALAALRGCVSSDPVIVKGLADKWREAEDSLKFVQVRAAEAVDARIGVIKDVGMGGPGLGLDFDITHPEDQKIAEFMAAGGRSHTPVQPGSTSTYFEADE